jgi:hypothetical protein
MADNKHGKGEATKQEGLHTAFDRAWDNAKANGLAPGKYAAQIEVTTTNPIHSYIVILTPSG